MQLFRSRVPQSPCHQHGGCMGAAHGSTGDHRGWLGSPHILQHKWQPTGPTLPRQVGLGGKEEEAAGLWEQLLYRSPVSPWGHAPAAWAE